MDDRIKEAHEQIDGKTVARMVLDFHLHFRGVYGGAVMASTLCAVGPLQAMIGLAIKNGLLAPPPPSEQ